MKKLIGALVTSAFISMPTYASLIIDDYSDGNFRIEVDSSNPTGFNQTLGSMLGGERDIYIEQTDNPGTDVIGANAAVGGGSLYLSNDSGVMSTTTITWDGIDDDPLAVQENGLTGGTGATGGFDFFLFGDALAFTVIDPDTNFNFSINIWSNGGTDFNGVTLPAAGNSGLVLFPLLSLIDDEEAWKDVTAFQIVVEGLAGGFDIEVGDASITNVPEPASLGIFGLSLLGFGALQRKRKQKNLA